MEKVKLVPFDLVEKLVTVRSFTEKTNEAIPINPIYNMCTIIQSVGITWDGQMNKNIDSLFLTCYNQNLHI